MLQRNVLLQKYVLCRVLDEHLPAAMAPSSLTGLVRLCPPTALTCTGLEPSTSEEAADLDGCCWLTLCETTQPSLLPSRVERHLTTGFQRSSLTKHSYTIAVDC